MCNFDENDINSVLNLNIEYGFDCYSILLLEILVLSNFLLATKGHIVELTSLAEK